MRGTSLACSCIEDRLGIEGLIGVGCGNIHSNIWLIFTLVTIQYFQFISRRSFYFIGYY